MLASRQWPSARTWPITLILWLAVSGPALCAEPVAALLPTTAEGVGPGTLEVIDETILQKIPGLEYEPLLVAEKAAQCTSPGCPGEARTIGEAVGAVKIVATHLVEEGDEIIIRMFVHDVATGATEEASARATASGLLARVIKLLKEVLPKPAPPVMAKPAPPEPEPVEDVPSFSELPPGSAYRIARKLCTQDDQSDASLRVFPCMWADRYRAGMILIGSGAAASIIGASFTIASGVLWKQFDDWKDNIDRDCVDCISRAVKKVKVNAAITGLAIAFLLPGAVALVAGIVQRSSTLKQRSELDGLIPVTELHLSRSLDGGSISLTWRF